MKKPSGALIPVDPDTQEALDKALEAGESAKVKLEGNETVFLMTKAEKGSEYELSPIAVEKNNNEMRSAFDGLEALLK